MVPRAPQRGMGPPIPPVTCAHGLLGLALTTRYVRLAVDAQLMLLVILPWTTIEAPTPTAAV